MASLSRSLPKKTADDNGHVPEPEEAKTIAAIRAKAAPAKTPPHITNDPTLLTGLAVGDTLWLRARADKDGQYSDYACGAKANGPADHCSCRAIREEQLDKIVLAVLEHPIFEPARLRELLDHVIEASGETDEPRARDLQQARAERTRAETGIGKLMELLETGLMSPRDPTVAKRFADHRTHVASSDRWKSASAALRLKSSNASPTDSGKSSRPTIRHCARLTSASLSAR